MRYKRILRRGMRGADVLYIKERLFLTGSYDPMLPGVTSLTFGMDTYRAVRRFQSENRDADGRRLAVDGIIGRKTWAAIEAAQPQESALLLPGHIGGAASAAIAADLVRVSALKRELVLHALTYAVDPANVSGYPRSLYIRGGNLYNTDLTENVITAARIEAGAKRQPQYYDGGRKEMMLYAVRDNPALTGADCSGGVVGLLRRFQLVRPTFDATANTLMSRAHGAACEKDELRPGDWVGRSGHIGLYVGGGYVVEWVGGAFGCQLTRLDGRRCWDFVTRTMRGRFAWTRFTKPVYY